MLYWSVYLKTAKTLARWGFNAIPLPPLGKAPCYLFREFNRPDSRRVEREDLEGWRSYFTKLGFTGTVGTYLLPNSKTRDTLAIVDIDNPMYLEQVLSIFPETPAVVTRAGAVKHLYYRTKDARRSHLLQAWGSGSVDIISTTGVVFPGSVHADGQTYEADLSTWKNLPFIDLEIIDELRKVRRKKNNEDLAVIRKATPPVRDGAGFVHAREPREQRNSVWCGYILPRTAIDTEHGDTHPLEELPAGTRCFAMYREDASASAQIRDYKNKRYFFDMSPSPKRYWTMTDNTDEDLELEREDGDNYTDTLAEQLATRLGVEVKILPASGWIGDQVPLLEDNTTGFIVASHGAGKTVHAKKEHDRAATSIAVCNTQALTIANAAVLGLTAIYDDIAAKASCCVASIARYDMPPEFFHVDEADANHGFLHAGKVDEPLKAWRTLMHFAARSVRSLFASADLSFEDIALFVGAIRARNATRRFVVYIKRPTSKLTIHACSIGYVRGEIHRGIKAAKPEDPAMYIGITTRKLAGQLAQGYRSDGARNTRDLSDIADAIDTPTPDASTELSEALEAVEASETSPFFVSGENSRYVDSVRWLEDTDRLVREHSLLCTSPAVQSGVSLDPPVSSVRMMHTHRDVPADAVLQMIRRARNPVDTRVLLGIPNWKAQEHRTDRQYLEDVVAQKASTTVRAVTAHFPDFSAEDPDPEFALSWRITTRRAIRSYADPLGELKRAAERHGIGWVVDETPANGDARRAFARVISATREFRDKTNARQVSSAPDIDHDRREKLSRASTLQAGERQELERSQIAAFYRLPVTPELVRLDGGGKYRTTVRNYTHVVLSVEFPEIVAYRDHRRGTGKEPTAMAHELVSAMLLADLFEHVTGSVFSPAGGQCCVHAGSSLVWSWWRKNAVRMRAFFKRISGPQDEYEIRWLCERFRALGAKVTTTGASDSRVKIFSFDKVDQHAEAYALSLFESYEQRTNMEWRKTWNSKKN